MQCPICGSDLPNLADSCPSCGASMQPSPGIQLGADGSYHWTYRMDLRRNSDMLWLLLKVFNICYAFFPILSVIAALAQRSFDLEALVIPVLVGLFMNIIIISSWFLYLVISGGEYWIMTSMDENGLRHRQMNKTYKQAQILSLLAMALANAPGAKGAAMAGTTAHHWYGKFIGVRSVVIDRKHDRIGVNGNQNVPVYAAPEDYDFVLEYILSKVPQGTKVTEKN